jgi:hypothetical protein
VRIPSVESPRFPEEGSSAQGKSGPKPRLKSVGDGQQVEIPVPPPHRLSNGGTQKGRVSALMDMRVQAVRLESRKIRFPLRLSCDGEGNISTEVPDPTLPRKASSEVRGARTANRHR